MSFHPSLLALVLAVVAMATAPSAVLRAHGGASAAEALKSSLTEDQAAAVGFDFGSAERRNWHFVPRARNGLAYKDLTDAQRELVHDLMRSALSADGYGKAVGVMTLEGVLGELEGRPDYRDPERYFVTLFGTPGDALWGWRFEGHHLSLNFTVAGDEVVSGTPGFLGANPARVPRGPKEGWRLLADEEDLGRALVLSLDRDQREKAIIMSKAPRDIFNMPGREPTSQQGVAWGDLDAGQRDMLVKLILEYIDRLRPEHAAGEMSRVEESGFEHLHFAWAGSTKPGEAHYYRVQGTSFVLEYDNIQNGANHIHCVWRDFDRDFGADLLGEHYRDRH